MRELGDLDVLIIDCQATGATPALGAVLEIGWCILRPSRAEPEHLQAHAVLLPEGHAAPAHVRRLIGFDPRHVPGAVAPDAAWRLLRTDMNADPMPTVIHFARFELTFLRDWAARFEPGAAFPFDPLCLHAVACRLYPDLPRLSLRALAGHLGHGLHLTRRSLGHVEATAFIWQKLSAELRERGVRTWEELSDWLTLAGPGRSRSKRRYPLASARYRALPDQPGVYRFLRSNGDVLYVGKAQSLRQRVTSHFRAGSTREHSLEMLTQVSDVQVTLTPTALEAAVLENESIKALRPPYNLQLTSYDARAWFATRELDSASTSPDARHHIGPVPSELSLSALGALIALRSGERPTRSLMARALCAAERWAPEPQVFAAGYDELTRRHFDVDVDGAPKRHPRQAVLRAARRLVALSRQSVKTSETPEPDAAEEERLVWDPERVARHLERALCQAYQLLRRGYWLRLLHDSAIMYREPGSERSRRLLIRGGLVAEASDHDALDPIYPPAPRANFRRRPEPFDRAKYDRLRVLGSELKRVRRDGGSVAVYLAPERRLSERILDGIFGCV